MDFLLKDGLIKNCFLTGFSITFYCMHHHQDHYYYYGRSFLTLLSRGHQGSFLFILDPNTTHLTQLLDKGAFSALKVAWRQKCHDFLCQNPGKTISRYDFSKLFSSAWFSAMTMTNIISGFKVTGICPFNREVLQLPGERFSSFEQQTLEEQTGLAHIPLYRYAISTPV